MLEKFLMLEKHLFKAAKTPSLFLILCALAINDEAQQGGQSGFTILAALLSRFCLQIFSLAIVHFFTGNRAQTRTGTGGDFLKEELLKRLSHKNIGCLGKSDPFLPHDLLPSSAPPSPIVPTMKTFALISPHLHCN